LQQNSTILQSENLTLLSQITELKHMVSGLESKLSEVNAKNEVFEKEIEGLSTGQSQEEQDAFVDRLFKQIDHLNDQRLALLDEKEQMAGQLLKMNEAIGSISQQVDNESIDVTGLNNHRKNVILAGNSSRNEDVSGMKEQINNLVREIDKCIALLSA
jgi:predicted  nucleic acid-binding Zn-ribbon protein